MLVGDELILDDGDLEALGDDPDAAAPRRLGGVARLSMRVRAAQHIAPAVALLRSLSRTRSVAGVRLDLGQEALAEVDAVASLLALAVHVGPRQLLLRATEDGRVRDEPVSVPVRVTAKVLAKLFDYKHQPIEGFEGHVEVLQYDCAPPSPRLLGDRGTHEDEMLGCVLSVHRSTIRYLDLSDACYLHPAKTLCGLGALRYLRCPLLWNLAALVEADADVFKARALRWLCLSAPAAATLSQDAFDAALGAVDVLLARATWLRELRVGEFGDRQRPGVRLFAGLFPQRGQTSARQLDAVVLEEAFFAPATTACDVEVHLAPALRSLAHLTTLVLETDLAANLLERLEPAASPALRSVYVYAPRTCLHNHLHQLSLLLLLERFQPRLHLYLRVQPGSDCTAAAKSWPSQQCAACLVPCHARAKQLAALSRLRHAEDGADAEAAARARLRDVLVGVYCHADPADDDDAASSSGKRYCRRCPVDHKAPDSHYGLAVYWVRSGRSGPC